MNAVLGPSRSNFRHRTGDAHPRTSFGAPAHNGGPQLCRAAPIHGSSRCTVRKRTRGAWRHQRMAHPLGINDTPAIHRMSTGGHESFDTERRVVRYENMSRTKSRTILTKCLVSP